MSFVHLHVHSEYSLLDGFSNIKKLVNRAKELEMPAVALTDHGTMFGVIDFYNAAKAAGVKPIVGVESYLAPRGMSSRDPQMDKKATHILLLAENQTGYQNLLKIASTAQMEGFYYYPRIDRDFLAAHSEGLICTSGCMSAEVPRLIMQGDMEGARKNLDWYYETFGKERFFLELQQHDIPELDQINKMLIDLGRRYEANFVATNDVHYIKKEDARLQDIMLAIQTGCLLSDPNRMRMTDNSYYMRTPEEMARLFQDVPGAVSNTLLIAERCEIDLGFKGYHLPEFCVPEGHTAETYLRELCEEGLIRRYGTHSNDENIRQRLDYELSVIHKMGFDAYFLIVWDLCTFAREKGIWYNARGSAAGSMVAYTLDITMVDPIEHGLIFERFLNPGRVSMPDIDLDFRDDRRAEMMEYTARKYGDDKVAQIITFGTLGARAALRDVARVMDIPLSEVDRVAKMVPAIPGKPVTIKQALEDVTEFKEVYQTRPDLRDLIDTAAQMEGVVRNAGTHAAGVIITDKPIIEYIPLHRPTGNAASDSPVKTVTQFEMSVVDSLGLLKVDFLGLATLTIMARACDLIRERHSLDLNLNNIPTDDPATYEMLGRGDTAGVFQVEGSGMRRWLIQMKPKELANVIAMVALFRPGPMDFIPGYIRRMHGEEPVEYRHELLEPIFKETYGYPVYQEQLMFAAMGLASYTAPEADDLRKAIAKKMKDKLEKHREKFVHGAVKNGILEDTAKAIFADWEEFARYGFNKCLPGDAEIVDAATGRMVKVEDLFTGQSTLRATVTCDTNSLKLTTGAVATVSANGVKPVFRLTTALGRSIEATGNHPFYTFDGWRNLEELQIGQTIAVPRNVPVEGNCEWPEHEVIALGHLLAEGNLCHPHSVYFYSQDRGQVDDFVRAAEQFDNVHCSVAMHKSTFSVYAARVDRQAAPGIVPWAKALGIWGKNARQKEIPPAVFELTNAQIGLLLSRMWEGDGHLDVQGTSRFYATASERMARQIQHLLLRLGIISRLRPVRFPYKEGRQGYQLFVTGHTNLARFNACIGVHFVSQARQQAMQALCAGGAGRGTKDVVPAEVKGLVRAAKERSDQTWMEFNQRSGIAQREFYPQGNAGKVGFSRQTLSAVAEYFDDLALRCYAESDIYWDRIVSLEAVGEKPTYDLEIPGTHNFVANDILVHNSHAVDYGVIAVQTGYLKVHYPVEYMTALLSVSKNDTAKVALYAADCRRMGIPVEAPDINASEWDFAIEDRVDEKTQKKTSIIRFGMGAVKNVGLAPVETIMKERKEGGPFVDLNDLARRVDLRHVGKRALECLIKVGALDRFGPRPALLEALDNLVSVSASHFKAAEMGQMSLFGGMTTNVDEIRLPKDTGEISRRDILNWERELIGLYVSDHPLSPYMQVLTEVVSHFSGQLADVGSNETVRVAGLVTRVRHHQSKAGKPMGFATIEDLQGNIELVIFPRTWEKMGRLVEVDKVITVTGRVDNEGAEPKILVDTISTEFQVVTSAERPSPAFGGTPFMEEEDPFAGEPDYPAAPSGSAPRQVAEAPASFKPAATAAATAPAPTQVAPLVPAAPPAPAAAQQAKPAAPILASTQTLPGSQTPAPAIPAAAHSTAPAPALAVPPGNAAPSAAVTPSPAAPPVLVEPPVPAPPPPTPATPAASGWDLDGPPPPEPPEDWDLYAEMPTDLPEDDTWLPQAGPTAPVTARSAAPATVLAPFARPPAADAPLPQPYAAGPANPDPADAVALSEPELPAPASLNNAAATPTGAPAPHLERPPVIAPYLMGGPTVDTPADEKRVHMITIILRSTGDKTRDVLRLRRIHGIITSYPGKDRFAFHVFERGRGYLLEFPNSNAGLCQEMLQRLSSLVGADNVKIEPLTFQ